MLIDNINRRLTPQAVKIRAGIRRLRRIASFLFSLTGARVDISASFPCADIEVACYGYDGIDAVKDALRAGLGCSTEVMPIKVNLSPATVLLLTPSDLILTLISKLTSSNFGQINLIAPPRYVMTTTTLERTEGLSVLNQAMAAIKEKIEEKRGVFNIQMEVNDINTAR